MTRPNDARFSFGTIAGSETSIVIQCDFRHTTRAFLNRNSYFSFYLSGSGSSSPQIACSTDEGVVLRDAGFGADHSHMMPGMDLHDWVRLKIVLNLAANGGDGAASVYYQNLTDGDPGFIPVPGLQDVDVNILSNSQTPAAWNRLSLDGRFGSPTLGGVDNLTVILPKLPAPRVMQLGSQLSFAVDGSTPGITYQLQATDSLAAGQWQDLEAVRAVDAAGVSLTAPLDPTVPKRFYRIVLAGPNEWRLINSSGPSGGGIAAYDSDRHVAVMFACVGSYPNDTWEFDGLSWRQISVPGSLPHGRDGSGRMVYDPLGKRMIMQGGWWPDDNDSWTWEYRVTGTGPNDRQWVNLVETTCAYRGANGMAYDSTRNQVLNFGGNHHQSFYNDTWRFDCATDTWTHVVDWGPSRFAAGLVYDSGRDKFVMFGGSGRWWAGETEQGRGNTCEFDPDNGAWTEVLPQGAPNSPAPRWFPTMVHDAAAGVTIMKGGGRPSDGYAYTDTWEWNGTTWKELPTPPGQPTGGAVWYDTARQRVVIFSESKTWVYYR